MKSLLSEDSSDSEVAMNQAGQTTEEKLDAELVEIQFENRNREPVHVLTYGEQYTVRCSFKCNADIPRLAVTFRLQKPNGQIVYGTSSMFRGTKICGKRGEIISVGFSFDCRLSSACSGSFLIGGGVAEVLSDSSFRIIHLLRDQEFEVVSHANFAGDVDMGSV